VERLVQGRPCCLVGPAIAVRCLQVVSNGVFGDGCIDLHIYNLPLWQSPDSRSRKDIRKLLRGISYCRDVGNLSLKSARRLIYILVISLRPIPHSRTMMTTGGCGQRSILVRDAIGDGIVGLCGSAGSDYLGQLCSAIMV
jgi:hypothetical protein